MIAVTKLGGQAIVINAELIKYLESTPDTMVTLINGERLIVQESLEEIVRRAIEYGRALRVFAA